MAPTSGSEAGVSPSYSASTPYPELEAIPPAPPRSAASSTRSSASALCPVPSWIVRIFSSFPLHVWLDAEVVSPEPSPPPRKPTLYVAPHLNRDGTLASTSEEAIGWSSSDPVCLQWQLELLFRGVDFDVQFIDPSKSWGPGGQIPFLHLPPAFQPPSGAASTSRSPWIGQKRNATVPSLLTASSLPHFLDNHFPLWRPELGEKADSSPIWKDKATELESRSWQNLLSGRVMAGVLLAVLLSPHAASVAETQQQPYLSSLLSSQLQTTFLDDQLRRISALNPKGRAQPTRRLPGWEVGLLGWIGAHSMAGGQDAGSAASDDDAALRYADPVVDESKVLADAIAGIEALGLRTQSELEGTDASWILNASRPTRLDALAFAIIHTVMTLAATQAYSGLTAASATDDKQALLRLKAAIEGKPWLVSWSRRVWKDVVRDKERRTA